MRLVRFLPLAFVLAILLPGSASAAETGINVAVNQNVDGPAAARDARVGWVREFVSWEAAEPRPGQYDEFYLNNVRRSVRAYADRVREILAAGHEVASRGRARSR